MPTSSSSSNHHTNQTDVSVVADCMCEPMVIDFFERSLRAHTSCKVALPHMHLKNMFSEFPYFSILVILAHSIYP